MENKHDDLDKAKSFSLALGGPLYQLYLRAYLLKPPLNLLNRRMLAICLFAWLPLPLLSALTGDFVTGVDIPFLYDIDTHVRFLGALAFLLAAELVVHKRLGEIVPQFLEHGIITVENRSAFGKIINSAMRMRNSVAAELIMVIFIFSCGHWFWKEFIFIDASTWYATAIDNDITLTPAGYWYMFISLPLFQFISLRWYYRIFIWYQFIWRVSRLPLRFNALNPDKVGGIGFLNETMFAFSSILMAHTLLLSGMLANRILYQGATLLQFELEILAVIVFVLLLVTLPLLFFMSQLARAKRAGLREYSMTASQYVNDFRAKWLRADIKDNKEILGTPDIQSLADLSNSYSVANDMRFFPFDVKTLVSLAVFVALPLAPLLLTVIPIVEIINHLARIVL